MIEKEDVKISDWVQFLISQKIHAYGLITILVTILTAVIVLSIWYIDNKNYLGLIITTFFSFIIAYAVYLTVAHSNSILNRPKLLLNKILSEEIIRVEDIRKYWFNGEMPMVPTKKNNNASYKVNISDWLVYLEHESSRGSRYVFTLWSFFFATLALVFPATILANTITNQTLKIVVLAFLVIYPFILFILVFWLTSRDKKTKIGQKAEKLLYAILCKHEYQTIDELEKKWKEELKKNLPNKEYQDLISNF